MSNFNVPVSAVIVDACWSILQGESSIMTAVCHALSDSDKQIVMDTVWFTIEHLRRRVLTYVGNAPHLVKQIEVKYQAPFIYLVIGY